MTNSIQYPSFHIMKLQRPDHRAANYIKTQETKPELVVNLTKDEVSTRQLSKWILPTQHYDRKQNQICQRRVRTKESNDLGKQVDRDREHPTYKQEKVVNKSLGYLWVSIKMSHHTLDPFEERTHHKEKNVLISEGLESCGK
ncbi:hypothetical protein ACS0TY_022673 [Phlomoides rotata]